MQHALTVWLRSIGFPHWLIPDSLVMVGIAGFLGGALVLRQARRDRAPTHEDARALALCFVASWLGAWMFEMLWMLPEAIAMRSGTPLRGVGKSMYGGMIAGSVVPALYLLWRRENVRSSHLRAYLDRSTLFWSVTIVCMRVGCLLNGCDFGRPTASFAGVRFPADTPAAQKHVLNGWIRDGGAPSLPVHPTQVYEILLVLVAAAIAVTLLRRPERDGRVFIAWIGTYASGRFFIEMLRGDTTPALHGLSRVDLTQGQLFSLAILSAILIGGVVRMLRPRRRVRVVAALAITAALFLYPTSARAQDPPVPPREVVPVQAPVSKQHDLKIGMRLTGGLSMPTSRPYLTPAGKFAELDGLYRLRLNRVTRVDLGLELRGYTNTDAKHWTMAIPIELVVEFGRYVEVQLAAVPGHTWIDFESPYYDDTSGFGARLQLGLNVVLAKHISLGLSPLAMNIVSAKGIPGSLVAYEPRGWIGVAF